MTERINALSGDDEILTRLRAVGRELAEAEAPLLDIQNRLERILSGQHPASRPARSSGATASAYGDLLEFVHANTSANGAPLPAHQEGRRAGPSDQFAAAITTRFMAQELVTVLRLAAAPRARRRGDVRRQLNAACDMLILLQRVLPHLPDFTSTGALERVCRIGKILNERPDDEGTAFDPDLAVEIVLSASTGFGAALLAEAADIAEALSDELDTTLIDASDLDLFGLELDQPEILARVVWTKQTAWPQRLEDWVRQRSTQISSDTYQIGSVSRDDPGTGTRHVA